MLGEAFQFDWSEEPLVIGGVYERLQVAHTKLCASRTFRLLARAKGLRGAAFDPFGKTAERRMERELIQDYRARVEAILPTLTTANYEVALKVAAVPEDIRSSGHVKEAAVERARQRWAALDLRLKGGAADSHAGAVPFRGMPFARWSGHGSRARSRAPRDDRRIG